MTSLAAAITRLVQTSLYSGRLCPVSHALRVILDFRTVRAEICQDIIQQKQRKKQTEITSNNVSSNDDGNDDDDDNITGNNNNNTN